MATTSSKYQQQIEVLTARLGDAVTRQTSKSSKPLLHIISVLDIEGTTTALPFVTKVLFPYAEEGLDSFVKEMYAKLGKKESSDAADVALFRTALAEASKEVYGVDAEEANLHLLAPEAFVALLKEKMAVNSKVTYLKQIQGVMWRAGYMGGSLKGHVFDDVAPFMRTMHESQWECPTSSSSSSAPSSLKTSVEIYSSGSIAAQKLLFGYSTVGDLTPLLSGYYDPSTVGLKTVPESYANIRNKIEGTSASALIVFFTDSIAEVEACVASKAFDLCVFCRRPLNSPVTPAQEALLVDLNVPSIVSLAQFTAAVRKAVPSEVMTMVSSEEDVTDEAVEASLAAQVAEFHDAGELKIFA